MSFHQLGPLGQVDHRVAMSVCLSVCLMSPFHVFFLGLSLVLRSHDQIPARPSTVSEVKHVKEDETTIEIDLSSNDLSGNTVLQKIDIE